jgi:hypothetical protein
MSFLLLLNEDLSWKRLKCVWSSFNKIENCVLQVFKTIWGQDFFSYRRLFLRIKWDWQIGIRSEVEQLLFFLILNKKTMDWWKRRILIEWEMRWESPLDQKAPQTLYEGTTTGNDWGYQSKFREMMLIVWPSDVLRLVFLASWLSEVITALPSFHEVQLSFLICTRILNLGNVLFVVVMTPQA